MAKCLLAGDWHGNTAWATSVLEWAAAQEITHVFQAGDFGIWPGYEGSLYLNHIMKACEGLGLTLWITPGNHEDYSQIVDPETDDGSVPEMQVLGEGEGWQVALLPRGTTWEFGGLKWLSFGGAPSIDFEMRKPGRSWWPEEMIRLNDLKRLDGIGEIDVMIAHDAPDGGTKAVQDIIDTPAGESMWSDAGLAYAAEGRHLMNMAVEMVDPRMFVHGHFHAPDMRHDEDKNRVYLSLGMDGGEANVVVFDTEGFKQPLDKELDA